MNTDRLLHFKDSDILQRIPSSEARRLSPKAKDCQRQLDEATSVWGVDRRKFLFVFTDADADERQKVTVWGIKNPGQYQRIKTVSVVNDDDILEAIPVFLTEYFELQLDGSYRVDEDWYFDIKDELERLCRRIPDYLKPKQKLLRIWSGIMPKVCEMMEELCIRVKSEESALREESRTKSQVQEKRPVSTPLPLDPVPEKLVGEVASSADTDMDLLSAALTYDLAALAQQVKAQPRTEWQSREDRTVKFGQLIFGTVKPDAIDIDAIERANAISQIGDYDRHMEYGDAAKVFGKLYRSILQVAMKRNEPLSLPYLELLVNTRRFNKRLPKHLSEYIREVLDRNVHSKGNFWNEIEGCDTLGGKLRKLWIQCMSLRLYGYSPDKSYTKDELCDFIPDLIIKEDPDALLLYTRIRRDADFDTVSIAHFDEIILKKAASVSDKAMLLKLHAARLLYRATEKKLVPFSSEASGVRSQVSGISSEVSGSSSKVSDNSSLIIDNSSLIKQHLDWIPEIEHCLKMQEQGVSLRDFCLVKGLPYEEFKAFHAAAISEVQSVCASDPVLNRICTLPAAEQDEYARLHRQQREHIETLCESVAKLSGEKIDKKDVMTDPTILEPLINKMLSRINNNTLPVENAPIAFRLLHSFEELQKIEKKLDAFHRRHKL